MRLQPFPVERVHASQYLTIEPVLVRMGSLMRELSHTSGPRSHGTRSPPPSCTGKIRGTTIRQGSRAWARPCFCTTDRQGVVGGFWHHYSNMSLQSYDNREVGCLKQNAAVSYRHVKAPLSHHNRPKHVILHS